MTSLFRSPEHRDTETAPAALEDLLAERPQRRRVSAPMSFKGAGLAVAVAVISALVVYAASHRLTPTYQSSGMFRVSVPNQQGVNDSVVSAANDIASQYAQLASSAPVLSAAAADLHVPAATLNGHVTGGTVSAQNLVQVTASASSPSVAAARAQAAVSAMISYLDAINAQQASTYSSSAQKYLAPVNQTISALTAKLKHDSASQRSSDSILLASLVEQREQTLASLATNAAAGEPTIQLVVSSTSPSQVAPRPTLYALITFLVVLLVSLRVAYLFRPREGSGHAARWMPTQPADS